MKVYAPQITMRLTAKRGVYARDTTPILTSTYSAPMHPLKPLRLVGAIT